VTQAPTAETLTAAAQPASANDNAIDSLSLVKAVAPSLAKRYGPVVAALGAGVTVGFLLGRRKRKSAAAVVAEELQAALLRLLGTMSSAERLRL
ncbi:MAG TPA: carbon monoxide dehydrogenase, partial [Mycobacterium sp.]